MESKIGKRSRTGGWLGVTDRWKGGHTHTHTHKLNHVKKKVKNTQRNTDTLWMHI